MNQEKKYEFQVDFFNKSFDNQVNFFKKHIKIDIF